MGKYLILFLTIIFASCTPEKKVEENQTVSAAKEDDPSAAKGGRFYGGLLQLNEPQFVLTLFPPDITDAFSSRVSTQVYEGLFRYGIDDLKLKNGLAESYTTDETGKIYTFKLKKGVYFHDDACFPDGIGREFTAEDASYCLKKLSSPNGPHINKTYFSGLLDGEKTESIKALDKYTLQITLEEPSKEFVYLLAEPFAAIFPKEAEDKYGELLKTKAVGTGPFKLVICEEDISIVMKKNPNYYGTDIHGNKLPFLDAIDIKFIQDKNKELEEFKKGNLDLIYRLPTEHIIEIQDDMENNSSGEYNRFVLQKNPEMQTRILGFNTQHPILSDKNVRKAISFAVNRENILDFVMQGEGFAAGVYGVIPPVFPRYDSKRVKGFVYNKDSAQYYLGKSSLKGVQKLPELTLHFVSEGGRNTLVANEIRKELFDNLRLEIVLQPLSSSAFQELLVSGNPALFLQGIVPVNPAPGGFLYGFSSFCVPFPNSPRFHNLLYDRLVQEALAAEDIEKEKNLLQAADQLLTQEAPFAVLWYDEGLRLLQPHIINMPNNAMQYRNYAEVYFEKTQRLN